MPPAGIGLPYRPVFKACIAQGLLPGGKRPVGRKERHRTQENSVRLFDIRAIDANDFDIWLPL